MDNLRLILLLLGVLAIAAIWAFEVWRRRRNAALRDDPFLGMVDDDYDIDALPAWQEHESADDGAVTQPNPAVPRSRPATGRAEPPAPRPRDLFEAQEEDDSPPLGDLPPMRASRDDPVPVPPAEPSPPAHPVAAAPASEATTGPVTEREPEAGPGQPADPRPEMATRPPGYADDAPAEPDGEGEAVQPSPPPPAPEAVAPEPSAPAVTGDDQQLPGSGAEAPRGEVSVEKAANSPPPGPQRVLSLTVMARPGRRFVGHQIRAALESVGMRFGDMDIFHMHARDSSEEPGPTLFAAVNVLKPGTFDLASLGELATPGVALFMEAPGPGDPQQTFELMLDTARKLAERLGGEVGDAARQPLSASRLSAMRAVAAGEEDELS